MRAAPRAAALPCGRRAEDAASAAAHRVLAGPRPSPAGPVTPLPERFIQNSCKAIAMGVTKPKRGKDGNAVETVPGRPDLSLAEYLKSVDAEAKAEIDRGWRADMAEEHRQARKKDLEEGNRLALKEELQREIDWQIMVGNHRDLANVYARSMLLQSC